MGHCKRYKPEAKNVVINNKYSGFRDGISFGTKKGATDFIQKIKRQGVYSKFRIKTIRC